MALNEPKKWVVSLPASEWWCNTSYHTSLMISPFEAFYKYPPPQLSGIFAPYNISQEVEVTFQEKDHISKSLHQNLLQEKIRMKKYADLRRTDKSFIVGNMVYLKIQPYRETTLGLRNALKLSSKYYEPFKILKKVGNRAYQLHLPEGTKLHDVFHTST